MATDNPKPLFIVRSILPISREVIEVHIPFPIAIIYRQKIIEERPLKPRKTVKHYDALIGFHMRRALRLMADYWANPNTDNAYIVASNLMLAFEYSEQYFLHYNIEGTSVVSWGTKK